MPIGRKPRAQGSSADVELRSILTDKAHYLKALAHFYSQSDNTLVQAWVDGDFVHGVLDRINAVVGESDKLRVLAVGYGSEDTDIALIRKTFPALRQLEGKGDDSEVGRLANNRNSNDVRAELNSLHIPYNLYQYTRQIDLGSCLADHCSTDEGASLTMDYLTNSINFNKLAPANLKSEFCNLLKGKCVHPERRDEKDQRCYFANKMDVYIVSA